jgi:hypothetical protein
MYCEHPIALSARTVDLNVARADFLNLFDGPRLPEKVSEDFNAKMSYG